MKNEIITMQNVPEGMKLIDRYLPSDYCDTVAKRIRREDPLTPDYVFEEMFCRGEADSVISYQSAAMRRSSYARMTDTCASG